MLAKKDWLNIHFFLLIGINLYFIYYYYKNPNSFTTTVIIYWIQSILIGFFNFLNVLTLSSKIQRQFYEESLNVVDQESKPINKSRGCFAFFFLGHYLIFHIIYAVVLPNKLLDFHSVDWTFIMLCFWILTILQLVNFIENKRRNREEAMRINVMLSWPYLRILPFHIMIIAALKNTIESPVIFLWLKIIADVAMYVVYQNAIFRPIKNQVVLNKK